MKLILREQEQNKSYERIRVSKGSQRQTKRHKKELKT
jgi:hypothetical protein